jgi:hypothetical protein
VSTTVNHAFTQKKKERENKVTDIVTSGSLRQTGKNNILKLSKTSLEASLFYGKPFM